MNYTLSNSLGHISSRQDPDAASYINLVKAAGATVNSNQVGQINTFYKSAKSTGYYTSLKRLYLPIWGVAAANAIDMIGGTSGTFVGGVTHGAGFVQSNGTTGYFNFGTSPNNQGLTNSSSTLGVLIGTAPSSPVGWTAGTSGTPTNLAFLEGPSASEFRMTSYSGGVTGTMSAITIDGIFISSRTSTTIQKLHRRSPGGFSSITGSVTAAEAGPITGQVAAMARLAGASPVNYSTARLGAYFIGLGQSDDAATSLSLHLKTLWEQTTGLTLP